MQSHGTTATRPVGDLKLQDGNPHPSPKANHRKSCSNMKVFVTNVTLLQFLIIVYYTFTAGCFRTIEKRFHLTSTESGALSSVGDAMETCIVLFIGYLGLKVNKARLLSFMLFFAGCGSLMIALPYFIYGPKDISPTSGQGNGTSKSDFQFCTLGGFEEQCDKDKERNVNRMAFNILLAASALVGFGATGIRSLSISYLDENVPPENVGVYLGIFTAGQPLGPIIGFSLAAVLLKQPENLKESKLIETTPANPNWIGAWWLGYVITGCLIIVMSFTLCPFPKHTTQFYRNREKASRDSTTKNAPVVTGPKAGKWTNVHIRGYLKDFFSALRRLLTNPTYMFLTGAYVCLLYVIFGIFRNLARYMEIHFRQSAYMANVISAICMGVTSVLGSLLGGILMKRFKITPLGSAKLFVVCIIVGVVGTLIEMGVGCDKPNMAGTLDTNGMLDVRHECAGNCSCGLKTIHPICVNGSTEFFSPCHAGCTSLVDGKFTDCLCAPLEASVTMGYCQDSCSLVIAYAIIMCITLFISSIGKVPSVILTLRVIDEDLKPFAIAMQTFTGNVFGFIPGPLIFGKLIDSTCLVWQRSCGHSGACLFYNTEMFRLFMHGVTAAILFGGGLCAIVAYILVRRDTLRGRWQEKVELGNVKDVNESTT